VTTQARIMGNRAGRALLVATLFALVSAQPLAQAYDKNETAGTAASALELGMQAASRGEMALAARHFRVAADAGSPLAQYNLGRLHEAGLGVPRDTAQAVRYYRMASEQGLAAAQARLALLLARDVRVPTNPREAYQLAMQAAQMGEPDAFIVLGLAYSNGSGVGLNKIEAWYWYALVERYHPDPRQREWGRGVRMKAANNLTLEQIAATRQRVEAYRMPVAR